MSSSDMRQKRYISRNGLDIVHKPQQYFNSYSLMTGSVNYKSATYNLKKIDLKEGVNLTDLPEIQIINLNYSNPYLIRYYDYILEQEEIDGHWINRSVYILMENSDYDLRTYMIKYGPLSHDNLLKLCECLIGANYYLEKDIKIPHGDIRPQNVRIILNQAPYQKEQELTFKLSYFDDVLRANGTHNRNKRDSFCYMAPELLSSGAINLSYFNQNTAYAPSEELQSLINECPDEIRYDPFRADVFSVGLTIFSAATGIIFVLNTPNQPFEIFRDGRKESILIRQQLHIIKNKYQCLGLTELLRIMLTQNPLLRYDFEELAMRVNKMRERNNQLPHIDLVREESNLKHDYELLKDNYWELQEIVGEMKEKESEYQNSIEYLKGQLQRWSENVNPANLQTINYMPLTTTNLNDISAIIPVDDDNTSFLSSASNSPRKVLNTLGSNDKNMQALDLQSTGLVEQAEKLLSNPKELGFIPYANNPHKKVVYFFIIQII